MEGFVYLHTNGEVIFKQNVTTDPEELSESPFVRRWWTLMEAGRTPQRFVAWLKELYGYKVSWERIEELANNQRLGEFIPDWESQVKEGE